MTIDYYVLPENGQLSEASISAFHRDGVLVLENAFSAEEGSCLVSRMMELVESFDIEQHRSVFSSVTNEQKDDRYFLGSGGEIRFFYEKDALDEKGNLTVPKHQALNKVGHALHDLDPVFNKFSRQPKLARVVKALGMTEPQLLQSMYIFKQPKIGGEVVCHQDSPYLWTEPQSCIGLWFALEDATLENGCLWGIPGIHKESSPRARLVRVAEHRTELQTLDDKPWPEDKKQPLEVKAGTLVVLHGQFPHLSGPNTSHKSRHAYALHLIDANCHYPAENWLQRSDDFPIQGFSQA